MTRSVEHRNGQTCTGINGSGKGDRIRREARRRGRNRIQGETAGSSVGDCDRLRSAGGSNSLIGETQRGGAHACFRAAGQSSSADGNAQRGSVIQSEHKIATVRLRRRGLKEDGIVRNFLRLPESKRSYPRGDPKPRACETDALDDDLPGGRQIINRKNFASGRLSHIRVRKRQRTGSGRDFGGLREGRANSHE